MTQAKTKREPTIASLQRQFLNAKKRNQALRKVGRELLARHAKDDACIRQLRVELDVARECLQGFDETERKIRAQFDHLKGEEDRRIQAQGEVMHLKTKINKLAEELACMEEAALQMGVALQAIGAGVVKGKHKAVMVGALVALVSDSVGIDDMVLRLAGKP